MPMVYHPDGEYTALCHKYNRQRPCEKCERNDEVEEKGKDEKQKMSPS